ncbi:sulfotransferase family protein [Aquihabitans sp. McL0605]|uniref:sulfotransferase family protein n=1 Tax=Aquihabitans sp. McL0605 TaxID=3415671 RepID=UPI003CF840F7
MGNERFDRDRLAAEAIELAGSDDFGAPTWQEGLDVLLDGLANEAQLSDLGVEVAAMGVTDYLTTRLGITAYRAAHPEVAEGPVDHPIFIVGQPRTGTTILYDLLALDPALRAPLTWEVDKPCPPPETDTRDTDPRIDEVDAILSMADALMPGFTTFHPMGARLAQECVRITGGDFRSMIFPVQYRVPTYNRWLLHDADMAPAYRWHRQFLQHLQARDPAPQWLLKSPAHLWHLDALAAEYPDAVIVQTHRDPLKVITSVSALSAHLRKMASDDVDLTEIAGEYAEDIFDGLDRGMDARARGVVPPERIVDVHFQAFIADPIETVREIYVALGRDLDDLTAQRMRDFLAANPGDGGGGGSRYRFADTGLDAGALRARAERYQDHFGVATEALV